MPVSRIESLETFLVDRWCLLRIRCDDGTVGIGEAGVHGWPRPTACPTVLTWSFSIQPSNECIVALATKPTFEAA